MKRSYNEPYIHSEEFITEDVITTSGTSTNPDPTAAPTPAPTAVTGGGSAGTGEYGPEL